MAETETKEIAQTVTVHHAGEFIVGTQRCMRCDRVLIDKSHQKVNASSGGECFPAFAFIGEFSTGEKRKFLFVINRDLKPNEVFCVAKAQSFGVHRVC